MEKNSMQMKTEKARVAILGFRQNRLNSKAVAWDQGGHYVMRKESVHQEDI